MGYPKSISIYCDSLMSNMQTWVDIRYFEPVVNITT